MKDVFFKADLFNQYELPIQDTIVALERRSVSKVKGVATDMMNVHPEFFAAWVAVPLPLDILEVFGIQQTAVARTDAQNNISAKMAW